jgi:hypothetical protein
MTTGEFWFLMLAIGAFLTFAATLAWVARH